MIYTVYKLKGYKPYWKNDSTAVPEKHIEDLVTDTGAEWLKVSNSIEWAFPMEQLTLILPSEDTSLPLYIKVTDGQHNFYFYFNTWIETVGANYKGINLKALFTLDKYMTYWHSKLQLLKQQDPKVRHIYKFTDRILYKENTEGATEVEINFLKQKQFGNTAPTKEYQKIRSYIGGTNYETLRTTNKIAKSKDVKYIYVNVPANPYYVNTGENEWYLGDADGVYISQTDINNATLSSIKIYLSETSDNYWNINTPNSNHRYKYIVCKGSALKSYYAGKQEDDAPHYAAWRKLKLTNKLLLIPIPGQLDIEWDVQPNNVHLDALFGSNEIIKALSDLPVTDRINQWASLDPFGDEFIGMFECDVPPYMFWQINTTDTYTPEIFTDSFNHQYQSVNPDTLGNNAGIALNITHIKKLSNGTAFYTLPIFYIILDPNNITTIKNTLKSKFTDKLDYIIKNLDKWTVDTEPTLLNPLYYNETYYASQNSQLSLDMSYIDYKYLPYTPPDPIINIIISNNTQVAVDFGNANNLDNPNWDNKLSIIRAEISNNVGVLGSASANYYANNVNTGTTSFKVRQAEQEMAKDRIISSGILGMAGAAAYGLVGGATAFASGNILAAGAGLMGLLGVGLAGTRMASNLMINSQEQAIKNLQLRSSINNIRSSSDQLLVDPYIEAGIPTYTPDPKNPLFITYTNELHPWDKQELFIHILNNGYPYNNVDFFNSYDNRKLMNVLLIDINTSKDEILKILESLDNGLFSSNLYNNEFINWLGTLHRLYKTDKLINCTSPGSDDYQDNIEKYLPPIKSTNRGQ